MTGFTIGIPVYNEEEILVSHTERLLAFLDGLGREYEVLIGSNGSTDSTPTVGAELALRLPRVSFFHVPERGVGVAFREFVRRAQYPFLVSVDMDLSVELSFIPSALQLLESHEIVVGSKKLGRQQRSWFRKLASDAFLRVVRLLLGLRYDDYSIAAKAFRVDMLRRFADCIDSGTSYVLEMCYMTQRAGGRITQVPVSCEDFRVSKFNLLHEAYYKYGHLFRLWLRTRSAHAAPRHGNDASSTDTPPTSVEVPPPTGDRALKSALALAFMAGFLLASAAHAILTPGEREELANVLETLSYASDISAGTRAGELFRREETLAQDLEVFLAAWFAERPCTDLLSQWLRAAALDEPSRDARARAQEALTGALVGSVAATFDSLLPDELAPALASDPGFLEDLRARMQLLGELAWRADGLSSTSRRAHAARLARLVGDHTSVLRAEVTIDVGARPKLAVLRAQLFKMLRDLPRPFDAEAFVGDAGLAGIHAEIVRRHGIVVLDNNGFDLAQLDAIQQVLTAIPPELHRLTNVSQHEFLGNILGGRAEVELRGSVGVNLLATPVYAEFENQFPPDVEPRRIRTFCAALQHELNHAVEELTIGGDPALIRRRDGLVARAGRTDPLQYLRSTAPAHTFPDAPQELFASISNQYLTDSAHTLALAQARLAGGRTAPLDQFLFFADVYSRGGDFTLFFAQDEECNYSAYPVRVRRDAQGRIVRITWPGGDARFQLDRDGWVVR